jgi:predicted phosphoribosyltransferase
MKTFQLPFRDRQQAGQLLADCLDRYRGTSGLLVLALPRGGVEIGFEVACALNAPLDVFIVRKLGFPGNEEYAIGAIARGGVRVMNPMTHMLVTPKEIQKIVDREKIELARREKFYRGNRLPAPISGCTVIVVDDGLATGSTMLAALIAVRQHNPLEVIAAVPVGEAQSCDALTAYADEVICMASPEPFRGVGCWYKQFPQASDDQVCRLLKAARRERAAGDSAGDSGRNDLMATQH